MHGSEADVRNMPSGKRRRIEGEDVVSDDSNIISLDEWRRVKGRLSRMTLPELAMTTHSLIDLMIDLTEHLEDLQERVDDLELDP